jgi:hypothetical protein
MTTETAPAPVQQSNTAESSADGKQIPDKTENQKAAEQKTAEQKATAEAIRKLKLKVNGAERELAESDVIALAQKGLASDERFRAASAKEKRFAELVKAASSDPQMVNELLKTVLGKDPDDFYRDRVAEKVRKLTMDPKDLELHEAREKVRQYEEKEKKRQEEERVAQLKKAEDHYAQEYDKAISDGLTQTGLPISEDTIRMTAEIMLANLENGLELPMTTVMELVRDRYQTNFKKLFGGYDPEKLIEFIGDDLFRKMQSAHAKKIVDPVKREPVAAKPDGDEKPKKDPYETRDEFLDRIEKWKRGEK